MRTTLMRPFGNDFSVMVQTLQIRSADLHSSQWNNMDSPYLIFPGAHVRFVRWVHAASALTLSTI